MLTDVEKAFGNTMAKMKVAAPRKVTSPFMKQVVEEEDLTKPKAASSTGASDMFRSLKSQPTPV